MTTAHRPENNLPVPFHDAQVRVRYAETDQMGVVYHANYLVWFEVGRIEYFRALGVEYKQMEIQDDCHIVVVEAQCCYRKSARYDEVLRIRARIAELRSRTVHFTYEVWRDADEQLLATGETKHVICGKDGKPKHLPEKYRERFAAAVPGKTAHGQPLANQHGSHE